MPSTFRAFKAVALLGLLIVNAHAASLSDLPTLSTSGNSAATSAASSTAAASASSSDQATSKTTQAAQSSSASSVVVTSAPALTSSSTVSQGDTATGSFFSLTNAPTIAGASIPTLGIPYTADAPFMQKSNLPEGTVFIAVGAVLAFMGVCVLLWRGLIAWSINRSVKRAALASIRGSEKPKPWGAPGSGYNPVKGGGRYSEYGAASNVSLEALNSAGKPLNKPHFRDSDAHMRHASTPPPAGLFFSPTAQASNRHSSITFDNSPNNSGQTNRNSTFLPAGYYASPSASQPAGGAASTTIGASLAPYARPLSGLTPSPPTTPQPLPTSTTRNSASYNSPTSRDGLRPNARRSASHDTTARVRDSVAYGRPSSYAQQPAAPGGRVTNQPSSSSLMVASGSTEALAGTRVPSAYLDDLFENHGNGPRERF